MYSRRAESRNVDVSNSPRPSAAVYLRWARTWSFMHNLDVMRRIKEKRRREKKGRQQQTTTKTKKYQQRMKKVKEGEKKDDKK